MSQQDSDLMMQTWKVRFGVKPYLEVLADQQQFLKPLGRLAEQKLASFLLFSFDSYDNE